MKSLLIAMVCIYPLKIFVVEDLIDIHNVKYVSVCSDNPIDALVRATHATVWTQEEWEQQKDWPGYKSVDQIKGWAESK